MGSDARTGSSPVFGTMCSFDVNTSLLKSEWGSYFIIKMQKNYNIMIINIPITDPAAFMQTQMVPLKKLYEIANSQNHPLRLHVSICLVDMQSPYGTKESRFFNQLEASLAVQAIEN